MAKIIEVSWLDACSFGNMWVSPDDEVTCSHCKSVGYLLKKDKDKIIIAQSDSNNGEVMNRFVIPKGCITGIKELSSE